MDKIVVMSEIDMMDKIREAARLAAIESAKFVISSMRDTSTSSDRISEEEAMKLLGCKKRRLATLRSDREIEFYTATKPYMYSRQSIMDYIERQRIKRVDLS